MAIKFTDKEPEPRPTKTSAPKPEIKPDKGIPNESIEPELPHPKAERHPKAVQFDPPDGVPQGQLSFAKSEPKPRGRKKPLK